MKMKDFNFLDNCDRILSNFVKFLRDEKGLVVTIDCFGFREEISFFKNPLFLKRPTSISINCQINHICNKRRNQMLGEI